MKAQAVGELILVAGLLLLAWVVWEQQNELAELAMLVGDIEVRTRPRPRQPRKKAEASE